MRCGGGVRVRPPPPLPGKAVLQAHRAEGQLPHCMNGMLCCLSCASMQEVCRGQWHVAARPDPPPASSVESSKAANSSQPYQAVLWLLNYVITFVNTRGQCTVGSLLTHSDMALVETVVHVQCVKTERLQQR